MSRYIKMVLVKVMSTRKQQNTNVHPASVRNAKYTEVLSDPHPASWEGVIKKRRRATRADDNKEKTDVRRSERIQRVNRNHGICSRAK